MKRFNLVYVVHFHDITQKASEQLEADVNTANDLINFLDVKYPGIADMLRSNDGTPDPRNSIVLNRAGERARHLTDFSVELRDGDRITLL
jgi:molybdopterin converting factor small subunit